MSGRLLAAMLLGAAIPAAGVSADRAAAQSQIYTLVPVTPYRAAVKLLPLTPNASESDRPLSNSAGARITVITGNGDVLSDSNGPGGDAVCVRLCDGSFFPLPAAGDAASETAACQSLCPDAATEVYYRNGSDRIEDAVSAEGRPYTALPASLRYRETAVNACVCHRGVPAYSPLGDPTLRSGDAIMTPAGFVVFRGAEGADHGPDDFAPLARSGLPSAERGALQAMERVSLEEGHPTLKQWLASQTSSALAEGRPGRAAYGHGKIRLLVWRGGAQD